MPDPLSALWPPSVRVRTCARAGARGRTHVALAPALLLVLALLALAAPLALAADPPPGAGDAPAASAALAADYPQVFGWDSRRIVWFAAQLHLLFGAFVLGVPIFAVIVEAVGLANGEARYDRLAREFTRLLTAAFSTTMALGGLLTFVLLALYPKVMTFLARAERPSMIVYPFLFFGDAFTLYLYHYAWGRMTDATPRTGRAACLRAAAWWASAACTAAAALFWLNPAGACHADPWVEFRTVSERNSFFAALGDKVKEQVAARKVEPTPAGIAAALEKGMDGLRTPRCFAGARLRDLAARLRAAARAQVAVTDLPAAVTAAVAAVGEPAAAEERAWLAAVAEGARKFIGPKVPVSRRGLATVLEQGIAAAPVAAALQNDDARAACAAFAAAARELKETPDPAAAVDQVIESVATRAHETLERTGAALAARHGLLLGALALAALVLAGVAAAATHAKALHLYLGVLLNVVGTVLMMVANSWVTFMMSPAGINKATGLVVSYWNTFFNPLWMPLNLHRLLGNVAFGGFICGAYAAMRYLAARTHEAREHYDWMGYVGNFVGVAGLIPLPFAGYYLGREVYSADINMGMQMMGGTFSWHFIVQAILIGSLFLGANYYFWMGIHYRSGLADRYSGWLVWINGLILVAFAVWLTPRNLPLTGEETAQLGGTSHPILKYLGLMSGKLAAVNMMILMSFVSFLLYRRSGLGAPVPLRARSPGRGAAAGAVAAVLALVVAYVAVALHLYPVEGGTLLGRFLGGPAWGWGLAAAAALVLGALALRAGHAPEPDLRVPPRRAAPALAALAATAALLAAPLLWLAATYGTNDLAALAALGLRPEDRPYLDLPVFLLAFQAGLTLACVLLAALDLGKLAQALYFLVTLVGACLLVGTYGYVVMEKANEGLRILSVTQVMLVLSGLVFLMALDLVIYRGAPKVPLTWGRMPARSQYVLLFLAVMIVLTMSLMGFVRSGLRENWHVRNVLQDTSPWSATPSTAAMGWTLAAIVVVFLGLVSFIFWLMNLGEKEAAA